MGIVRKAKFLDLKKMLSLFKEHKDQGKKYMDYQGSEVKMISDRYDCFSNELNCISCGVKGFFFAMEKHDSHKTEKYHWNLYGIKKDGSEVLLTKDHIKPKSLGGKNHISNYQTMCQECNQQKGDIYKL